MKYLNIFLATILLLTIIDNGCSVFAMDAGFSTEQISKEDANKVVKNINIRLLTNEPPKRGINCFSVNEDGKIAIGSETIENKTICIYTSDGVFQRGYSFSCSGSFGIELDNNTLIIYLVRSDLAITVDQEGRVEKVLRIQNTPDNNSYWNNTVFASKIKVKDAEYTLENSGLFNKFSSSYSRLAISVNGEKTIIYDVSTTQNLRNMVGLILIFSLICSVLYIVLHYFKQQHHAETETNDKTRFCK